MISLLNGRVIEHRNSSIVVLTNGGVGYDVQVNPVTAGQWKVGDTVTVTAYLAVREDALELYGFARKEERELFLKLLLVNGIGPKTALHILSLGTVEEIAAAVDRGDVAYLTTVSGVGTKMAERIVVELKNKLAVLLHEATAEGGIVGDAVEGLMALGYSAADARAAVKKLDTNGKTSEQVLKEALQTIK